MSFNVNAPLTFTPTNSLAPAAPTAPTATYLTMAEAEARLIEAANIAGREAIEEFERAVLLPLAQGVWAPPEGLKARLAEAGLGLETTEDYARVTYFEAPLAMGRPPLKWQVASAGRDECAYCGSSLGWGTWRGGETRNGGWDCPQCGAN